MAPSTASPAVDCAAISAALAARRADWLPREFPAGRLKSGYFLIGDADGNPGKSLPIPIDPAKARGLTDFGNGFAGDDLDLFAKARGLENDLGEAACQAADMLGLEVPVHTRSRSAASRPSSGTRRTGDKRKTTTRDTRATAKAAVQAPAKTASPEAVKAPPERHSDLGAWSASWTYHDVAGVPVLYVCRFDISNSEKEFRPWTGAWKGLAAPRPLYDLPALSADPRDRPVLVVEGEKTADAAAALLDEYSVTTWAHGGKSVDQTDWAPLRDRPVTIWPDSDDEGRATALKVAAQCRDAGVYQVRIVDVPVDEIPEKWDLADKLPERWDLDYVRDLIARAPAAFPTPWVDYVDFRAEAIPEREMVMSPILPAKGLMQIAARRGAGKTYFTASFAMAVATGGRFLSWTAPRPRRVLYVDGEMDLADLQTRLKAIEAAYHTPAPGYLRIWSYDRQGHAPDISTLDGQGELDDCLADVDLLILDSISTLARTSIENAAEDWQIVQDWLIHLRRRGISVVLVHHTGWDGSHGRGTSRREDVLDTVIMLKEVDDDNGGGGGDQTATRLKVSLDKARGVPRKIARPFETAFEIRDGRIIWTTKAIDQDDLERVRVLVDEGLTYRDIAQATGFSKSKVGVLVKKIQQGT